jgi:5-bromo-4-chloroindolyl phosphate hydrolysis protein
MSDAMQEFARNSRYLFRKMWTWYETYIVIVLFLIVFSAIVGGSAKQEIIRGLERQVEQMKSRDEVVKTQNENSIKDRQYLHDELKNTRESLRRLEFKVRSYDLDK